MQWFETFAQGRVRVANAAVKRLGDLAFTGKWTVNILMNEISLLCCFYVTVS